MAKQSRKDGLARAEELRDMLDSIAAKNGRTRYAVGMELVRSLEDEIQNILMAIVLDRVEASVERIAKDIIQRSETETDHPEEPEEKP